MEILKFPDPNLFVVCNEVTVFGPELRILLHAMYDTMTKKNGIGLAANQVGLQFRMFTMAGPNGKLYLVNPVITAKSLAPANIKEGCLSAPGEFLILLERTSWVEVSYQDEHGVEKKDIFKGIYSVCAQHEIDHLNGKSHLQSASIPRSQRKLLAKKWGFKLK
jgi:peptide deformylase